MESKITRRIAAETDIPHLFSALTDKIAPGDLQSLLLEVYQARVRRVRESQVLARSAASALYSPSTVDARLLSEFDQAAFNTARNFEAIELSPVCPVGTNFVLGSVDQNSLLTTIRNAEVLGDSTPAMALECARRRRTAREAEPVRLCASHRVIRLQPFDVPGFTPHFRLFTMVSAGRDTGSRAFQIRHISEHIRVYLDLFRALNNRGFRLTSPLVEITDLAITRRLLEQFGITAAEVRELIRAHRPGASEKLLQDRGVRFPAHTDDPALDLLGQQVLNPLRHDYPEAEFRLKLDRLEGLNYYTSLALRISPLAPDGKRHAVVDGGFTDWTARLLQDRKERMLTSGIGTEFICRQCRDLPYNEA